MKKLLLQLDENPLTLSIKNTEQNDQDNSFKFKFVEDSVKLCNIKDLNNRNMTIYNQIDIEANFDLRSLFSSCNLYDSLSSCVGENDLKNELLWIFPSNDLKTIDPSNLNEVQLVLTAKFLLSNYRDTSFDDEFLSSIKILSKKWIEALHQNINALIKNKINHFYILGESSLADNHFYRNSRLDNKNLNRKSSLYASCVCFHEEQKTNNLNLNITTVNKKKVISCIIVAANKKLLERLLDLKIRVYEIFTTNQNDEHFPKKKLISAVGKYEEIKSGKNLYVTGKMDVKVTLNCIHEQVFKFLISPAIRTSIDSNNDHNNNNENINNSINNSNIDIQIKNTHLNHRISFLYNLPVIYATKYFVHASLIDFKVFFKQISDNNNIENNVVANENKLNDKNFENFKKISKLKLQGDFITSNILNLIKNLKKIILNKYNQNENLKFFEKKDNSASSVNDNNVNVQQEKNLLFYNPLLLKKQKLSSNLNFINNISSTENKNNINAVIVNNNINSSNNNNSINNNNNNKISNQNFSTSGPLLNPITIITAKNDLQSNVELNLNNSNNNNNNNNYFENFDEEKNSDDGYSINNDNNNNVDKSFNENKINNNYLDLVTEKWRKYQKNISNNFYFIIKLKSKSMNLLPFFLYSNNVVNIDTFKNDNNNDLNSDANSITKNFLIKNLRWSTNDLKTIEKNNVENKTCLLKNFNENNAKSLFLIPSPDKRKKNKRKILLDG
jgi:hypothetical protein